MLIFDDLNRTIILDSIYTPTVGYFWTLDLALKDFTVSPMPVLEEIVAKSLELEIKGFRFILPAYWNLLIVGEDTAQLDIVKLDELTAKEFNAFIFGPTLGRYEACPVRVTNYYPVHPSVAPSLHKHQMLCHPIAPNQWINVSPGDMYTKYLKDVVAGDLI